MRTQAIIIRKILLREHDELIVCFTNEAGKQTYHAKSSMLSRSKQGRHLDIMNHVDFSLISGNGHPIIASAFCFDAFRSMKSNLQAMSVAFFITECFGKLVFEGESDLRLWNFLIDSFQQINKLADKKDTPWKSVQQSMQEQLISLLGYSPDTPTSELHPVPFSSLQFHRKVVL